MYENIYIYNMFMNEYKYEYINIDENYPPNWTLQSGDEK